MTALSRLFLAASAAVDAILAEFCALSDAKIADFMSSILVSPVLKADAAFASKEVVFSANDDKSALTEFNSSIAAATYRLTSCAASSLAAIVTSCCDAASVLLASVDSIALDIMTKHHINIHDKNIQQEDMRKFKRIIKTEYPHLMYFR